MVRDDRTSAAMFGPVDPFCWFAVIPALLFAIVLALLAAYLLCVAVVVVVGLVLAFDSWVNRHRRRNYAR